jgi:glutathione S-transferase
MYFANDKIKKKYGIVNEREEMSAYLSEWTEALKNSDGQFLHGEHLTMPDLFVYSVIRSISGLQTFDDIMRSDISLRDWYQNVDKIVCDK